MRYCLLGRRGGSEKGGKRWGGGMEGVGVRRMEKWEKC